ncbi:MAG: DinB family protein [Anaerolineales bacterium]
MDSALLLRTMESDGMRIAALADSVSPEQARWKPKPDSWSILEVVNHDVDEEREDFRTRLDILLHRPADPWPKIDPKAWVTEKKYNERELPESLTRFADERRASLTWLRGLTAPKWEAEVHSQFGSMRAGDMFCAWVTHDQLHMRQLVELHRAYTEKLAEPYHLEYAGEW